MPHFGYVPHPGRTAQFVSTLPLRSFGETPAYRANLRAEASEVLLSRALFKCKPTWRRGAQGIGDCVSWGWELCGTMRLAIQAIAGESEWIEEVATESIYGGSRVEANGGRPMLGKTADGSYGGAAAKFVRQWGMLLRLDYSQETGNPEHDLRKYDGKDGQFSFTSKARRWGYYGCGGQKDEGKLDLVAALYPCDVTPVKTIDEAERAIRGGYPIAVCSNAGFGNMKRDGNGVVRIHGKPWAHCMMWGGFRRLGGRPQFRNYQSWGDCASGPDPGIEEPADSATAWWVDERDAEKMLRANDTFAVSTVDGFPPQEFDLEAVAGAWD